MTGQADAGGPWAASPHHLPGVDRDPPYQAAVLIVITSWAQGSHPEILMCRGLVQPGEWGLGSFLDGARKQPRLRATAEVSPQGPRVPGVEAAIPASFLRAPSPHVAVSVPRSPPSSPPRQGRGDLRPGRAERGGAWARGCTGGWRAGRGGGWRPWACGPPPGAAPVSPSLLGVSLSPRSLARSHVHNTGNRASN